jgi:hypothetical protein
MQSLHLLTVLVGLVFHLQLLDQQLPVAVVVAVVLIGLIAVSLVLAVLVVAVLVDKHQEGQLLMVLPETQILEVEVEVQVPVLQEQLGVQPAVAQVL